MTLRTITDLGDVYLESGRARQGIAMLERAFNANERNLGRSHPLSLTILLKLAKCHETMNEIDKSEELLKDVLKRQGSTIGFNQLETIRTRVALATTMTKKGNFEKAVKESRLALQTISKLCGPNHPETLDLHGEYVNILHRANILPEAIRESRHLLESHETILGIDHFMTNAARHNLAALLVDHGRPEELVEAEKLERRVLEVEIEGVAQEPAQAFMVLPVKQWLAKSLLLQGKLGEAETMARAAFNGCRKLLDPSEVRTSRCADILKTVLEGQGKPLDADLLLFLDSSKDSSVVERKKQKVVTVPSFDGLVQNPWSVGLGCSSCILVILIFSFYRMRKV
jgi:tetratricopeptide (TPR) repeat protein